jgi:hypothetical protein
VAAYRIVNTLTENRWLEFRVRARHALTIKRFDTADIWSRIEDADL